MKVYVVSMRAHVAGVFSSIEKAEDFCDEGANKILRGDWDVCIEELEMDLSLDESFDLKNSRNGKVWSPVPHHVFYR